MKTESIKKNFAYQMCYEVLVFILPFITSPYVSRVIGAKGLGIYSYTYSVANYFVLFGMLGIKNYGSRLIAKSRDDEDELNRQFSDLVTVHIIISLICLGIYMIYAFFFSTNRTYAMIQTFFVASSVFDIGWFYFGIEKFKLTVMRNSLYRILTVICVFTFVKHKNDLIIYTVILAVGSLLSFTTLWVPLRKYVKYVKPNPKGMMNHVKPMAVLFIPAIAISVYKYMDKIMVGYMCDKSELGYYENAEKVVNIPVTVISSFGTVMLSKMSNLAANKDKKNSDRYLSVSMKYIMWMSFGMGMGLMGVGNTFAPVFWGKGFIKSGELILWLSVTIPFIAFANVIRTQYLIPNERDKDYVISVVTGAVVNFIVNYLLIPYYGAMGATVGTIFAEASVCLMQMFMVRKNLKIGEYIKNSLFFLLSGLIMFIIIYGMGRSRHYSIGLVIIQVFTGGFLYCLMTSAYFYVTKDRVFMNMVNKYFRKEKK